MTTPPPVRQAAPSNAAQTACLVPFFGVFAVFGAVFLVLMFRFPLPPLMYAFALIPLTFIGVGIQGIRRTIKSANTSPERQVSTTQQALPLPKVEATAGSSLSYRLSPANPPAVMGKGLLVFGTFWTVLVCGFGSGDMRAGNPVASIGLMAFALIGFALMGAGIYQLFLAALQKGTVLETDREPACPGEFITIAFTPGGGIATAAMAVDLVCRENITYTRGTDTYHESHTLHEARIHEGTLRGERLTAAIPANAPVSFQGHRNAIEWVIRVTRADGRKPNVKLEYPFRVTPLTVRERMGQPVPVRTDGGLRA